MTGGTPSMPEPVGNGSTIRRSIVRGAIWLFVDDVTRAYPDFVDGKVALEIAAGYGHVMGKALERGARKLFVNEIDAGQLTIIRSRTPDDYRKKLVCCLGEFPERLEFEHCSFGAIYSARLLHFFDGDRIRTSVGKIARWLAPGARASTLKLLRSIRIPAASHPAAATDASSSGPSHASRDPMVTDIRPIHERID